MEYEEAIAYILGRSGMGKKDGLNNMRALLARLGDPHKRLKCLHVAGTNGKGSTCAFLDAVLREAGYQVGLYTSPYLMRYNERIQVDGTPIEDQDLARVTGEVAQQVERMQAEEGRSATVFEVGTAIAFTYFAQQRVDYAVIEVGLGGRLDCTNVIDPVACAITRIGLEHTRVLGHTVAAIAGEKAGIIKPGRPVVLQAQGKEVREVVAQACQRVGAELTDLADHPARSVRLDAQGASFEQDLFPGAPIRIELAGEYQVDNAMTALALLACLPEPVPGEAVRAGMASARWPGRLEWLNGLLLDGAHNPQGAATVARYLCRTQHGRKVTLLCGIMADKAVEGIVAELAPLAACVVCVRPENMERALPAQMLAAHFARRGAPAYAAADSFAGLAWARRLAGPDGVTVVCGSLYLVGEVRLREINRMREGTEHANPIPIGHGGAGA